MDSDFDIPRQLFDLLKQLSLYQPELPPCLQDCKIAERIEKEGKCCLIVVNKWDTIPDKNNQTAQYYEQDVRVKLRALHWAPIVYSTAIFGHSVDKIISAAITVEKERSRRLSTTLLNQVVSEAIAFKPPPRTRGEKRGRVFYCTQVLLFVYALRFSWIDNTALVLLSSHPLKACVESSGGPWQRPNQALRSPKESP